MVFHVRVCWEPSGELLQQCADTQQATWQHCSSSLRAHTADVRQRLHQVNSQFSHSCRRWVDVFLCHSGPPLAESWVWCALRYAGQADFRPVLGENDTCEINIRIHKLLNNALSAAALTPQTDRAGGTWHSTHYTMCPQEGKLMKYPVSMHGSPGGHSNAASHLGLCSTSTRAASSEDLQTNRPAKKKNTKWAEQNRTKLSTQASLKINVRNSSVFRRLLSPEARLRWDRAGQRHNHPLAPPGHSSKTASKWCPRVWGLGGAPRQKVWPRVAGQGLPASGVSSWPKPCLEARHKCCTNTPEEKAPEQEEHTQGKASDVIRGACDCHCGRWNPLRKTPEVSGETPSLQSPRPRSCHVGCHPASFLHPPASASIVPPSRDLRICWGGTSRLTLSWMMLSKGSVGGCFGAQLPSRLYCRHLTGGLHHLGHSGCPQPTLLLHYW